MSFDVYLQRFEAGESAPVEREPVRELLSALEYDGPDDFGVYVVRFLDGVHVEFSARGLESQEPFCGCAFQVRGIGEHLLEFIFNVAQAGDTVVMPVMEDPPIVLVSGSQEANAPPDLLGCRRPILVRSAGELGAVLTGGLDAWREYRDKVVRGPAANGEA